MLGELPIETFGDITKSVQQRLRGECSPRFLQNREAGVPAETGCIGGEKYPWLQGNCAHVGDGEVVLVRGRAIAGRYSKAERSEVVLRVGSKGC